MGPAARGVGKPLGTPTTNPQWVSSERDGVRHAEPVLLRTDEGGVARLTLNRPRQFNAIALDMLIALRAELEAIASDRSVRAVRKE
jgi:hypothetical protein